MNLIILIGIAIVFLHQLLINHNLRIITENQKVILEDINKLKSYTKE